MLDGWLFAVDNSWKLDYPSTPAFAVPNATIRPSEASVPITSLVAE